MQSVLRRKTIGIQKMDLETALKKRPQRDSGFNNSSIQSAYSRYSGVYDLLFGALFKPGRLAAVQALNTRPGHRVLEVGVGTGLSLPMYDKEVKVVGIDISTEMLAKARSRITREPAPQVEDIIEMDAQDMTFADNSFDSVVAMYAVSVVPDIDQMFDEIQRVCKPGGEFVLVNHFVSDNILLKLFENAMIPLSSAIGFRPNLNREDVIQRTGMELLETRAVNVFGYWTLMRFRIPR